MDIAGNVNLIDAVYDEREGRIQVLKFDHLANRHSLYALRPFFNMNLMRGEVNKKSQAMAVGKSLD